MKSLFSPSRRLALPTLLLLAPGGCHERTDNARRDAAAPTSGSVTAPAVASVASAPVDIVTNASGGGGWGAPDAGTVATTGDVDGKALRDLHRARIKADTTPVTVLEGGSPSELGARLCEAVVPRRPKDIPVLVKPNIGGFEWFKDPAGAGKGDDGVHGRTTDPEFVRGIVRCLKARGHTKITIAEGWGAKHADWLKLVRVSGYAQMAKEEGVPLVAMDDDGIFDLEGDQPGKPLRVTGMEGTGVPTLLMPKLLAEHLQHGMFISAPKIKAHRFGVVSMAIKGMQGTVMLSDAAPAFHQKWRTHRELSAALTLLEKDEAAGRAAYLRSLETFAERMTDVLEVEAPDVVLAEGTPMMGGDGFAKRWPSAEDIAIGGTNPILVDRVGAAMLGLWDNAELASQLGGHRTSPLIEAAAKRFGVDPAAPMLLGNGAALLAPGAPRRPVHFVSMAGWSLLSDKRAPELAPRGSSPAGSRPEAHAILLAKAPKIDGAIDEVWKSAPPVTFTTDWSGADSGIRTRVRFGWTKDALYMLWELGGAGLASDTTRPIEVERLKLYEEDCVELFVGPDAAAPGHYFEVEVGPLGHFLDLEVDRATKKSDVAWSSVPRIASSLDRDAHEATIEVELRAPTLVAALQRGAALPLALYRMEGKSPRRYLAWSPTKTPKPSFHVPEAFGTLKLD